MIGLCDEMSRTTRTKTMASCEKRPKGYFSVFRGFNKFWHKWIVQHNRRVLFWKAFLSRGSGGMPPRKYWNPRLSQTHFPAFWGLFLFCFVVLRSQPIWTNLEEKKWSSTQIDSWTMHELLTKKSNMISKFDHRKLALSMSSTNVRKNPYRSISLILTLEQNILITITSWQPLIFILSSHGFQLMPCTFLRFETFITRRFNWALLQLLHFKRWDTRQNVLSFTFAFCFL